MTHLDFGEILEKYKIVELSHIIEEGMPRPQVPFGHIRWKSAERGDAFNTFMLLIFEHAGTHVDAPVHHGEVKGPSLDEIPADSWMGKLAVLSFPDKREGEAVTKSDIQKWESDFGAIDVGMVVLFNLGWAFRWSTDYGVENQPYHGNNPGLSKEGASYLASKNVKLVGGDIPTIDVGSDNSEPAHRELLLKGILILENAMNLEKLPPKGSYFFGLPLRTRDGTGCPVRAIAFVPR